LAPVNDHVEDGEAVDGDTDAHEILTLYCGFEVTNQGEAVEVGEELTDGFLFVFVKVLLELHH
jgi:hypothetical protein